MLKDIVCNASVLGQFLTAEEGEESQGLQRELCALETDALQEAEQRFLSQLDFTKFFTVSGSYGKSPSCWSFTLHLVI